MAAVKTAFLALLLATIAIGCSTSKRAAAPKPAPAQAAPGASAAKPTVTPINARSGRVLSVKEDLRFIVIEFAVGGLPAEGRTMGVYRAGQKVADVKISGPVVGTNTAADILSGSVQTGDLVQDD